MFSLSSIPSTLSCRDSRFYKSSRTQFGAQPPIEPERPEDRWDDRTKALVAEMMWGFRTFRVFGQDETDAYIPKQAVLDAAENAKTVHGKTFSPQDIEAIYRLANEGLNPQDSPVPTDPTPPSGPGAPHDDGQPTGPGLAA